MTTADLIALGIALVIVLAAIVVEPLIVKPVATPPPAIPPQTPPADDSAARMPGGPQRVLVGYLMAVGLVLVYLMAKLYALDFPETPFVIEVPAAGAVPVTPVSGEAPAPDGKVEARIDRTPELIYIFPQLTLGTAASSELAVYGRNFDSLRATVRLNRQTRGPKRRHADLLVVATEPSDLVAVGTLVVEVVNPGGRVSNAMSVSVIRPRMPLRVFRQVLPITREVQLILLVLCAGALGSYVHALKSLGDFIGNRSLMRSWFWWYITRPFLGMALAFIFYAVLRGGFLTGTPADVRVVNPFGAIAVAALVGMFADRAAQKLAEIFDALFKGEDPRGGKLAGPIIAKLEPVFVRAGSPTPPLLKIIGDRLGKVSSVRIDGQERAPKSTGEREVTVQLQPSDVSTPRDLAVTVVTPDGSISPPSTLHVSNLDVATASPLPARVVAAPYAQTLVATGGVQPYSWVLSGAPAWLGINPSTGALTGTPPNAGPDNFDVQVTDTTGASTTKKLVLP
jgi:hypothetical protein